MQSSSIFIDPNYDDSDEPWDPAIELFGTEDLVVSYRDLHRVQQLVNDGHTVTPNAVLCASFTGFGNYLDILLTTGPDVNARLPIADDDLNELEIEWAMTDVTPYFAVHCFGDHMHEWYSLQNAATGPLIYHDYGRKEGSHTVLNTLLRHNANLFAILKQPIEHDRPSLFPNDTLLIESWGDDDDTTEFVPRYGLRTVLHSLLEDGAYVKPILEYPDLEIDLERRDPQGRTLLHSACRSTVGADVMIDISLEDTCGSLSKKPFIATEASESSVFHVLRKRGADLTAKDCVGKTILHHLLEARSTFLWSDRLPPISNTLNYIVRHQKDLINLPDRHGTYPLHTSLQRLRSILLKATLTDDPPLEEAVHTLLDAGADATRRDGRGNTALHYLADNSLTAYKTREQSRLLCQRFCSTGIDVNARNNRGRTALEILMDDNGALDDTLSSRNTFVDVFKTREQIQMEVFKMFDSAGADWTEQDLQGRTLLHLVAKHRTDSTVLRFRYLLMKGVDINTRDHDGNTVEDFARQSNNVPLLEILRKIRSN